MGLSHGNEGTLYLREMLDVHLSCVVDIFPPENPIVQGHGCVVVDELKNL